MAHTRVETMDVELSVAAGDAVEVGGMDNMRMQTAGTFTATMDIQESVDGSTWADVATGITAPAMTDLSSTKAKLLRINTTSYSSGTPVMTLFGREDANPDKTQVLDLDAEDAVGNGDPLDVGAFTNVKVQVTGITTGTLHLEESQDGSNWVQVGADITADDVRAVSDATKLLRLRTSVDTSVAVAGNCKMFGTKDLSPH